MSSTLHATVKQLNDGLFHRINSIAGKNKALDILIIFVADWLMLFLVISPAVFLFQPTAHNLMIEMMLIYCALVGFAFSRITKLLVHYTRPETHLQNVTTLVVSSNHLAFPSDHTAVAVAGALGYFYFVNPLTGLVLFVVALVIGISRIAAGVHYPLDVAASTLLGIATSTVLYLLSPQIIHATLYLFGRIVS